MNIVEALDHPKLFGPHFSDPTWAAWRAFLKASYGLPLTRAERAIYKEATGRKRAPKKQAREVYAICGRRGGKDARHHLQERGALRERSEDAGRRVEVSRRAFAQYGDAIDVRFVRRGCRVPLVAADP